MLYVGIDLGGHTISAGLVLMAGDASARIVRRLERPTPSERTIASVLDLIAAMTTELIAHDPAVSVGVGCPGVIDRSRRTILELTNFVDGDNAPFVNLLVGKLQQKGLTQPVYIENDANCYALGEGAAGIAAACADYVVFTLGTGVGGGIVVGGKLLSGAHGLAGELGHIVTGHHLACVCGGQGHLETVAAADGVQKRARLAGFDEDFRVLWARRHEPSAVTVLAPMFDHLGRAVATVAHLLDPELVVLGGGMSRAEGIVEEVAKAARPYLMDPFAETLRLERSILGNDAALIGAAGLGRRGAR